MSIGQLVKDKRVLGVLALSLLTVFTVVRINRQASLVHVVQYSNSASLTEITHSKESIHINLLPKGDGSSNKSSKYTPSHQSTLASSLLPVQSTISQLALDKNVETIRQVLTENNIEYNFGKDGATIKGDFYQVSEGVFVYSGFIDRRYGAVTVRLIGIQDRSVRSNITCMYRMPNTSSGSDKSTKNLVNASANYFTVYSDWPSPNVRYLAYVYACHTPKNWFNRSNPACGSGRQPLCGVEFTVLSTDGRYETVIPLQDESPQSFSFMKNNDKKLVRSKDRMRDAKPKNFEQRSGTENQIKDPQKEVLLCVKAVFGTPSPTKLAEWVEFNKELGVNKIVIYDVASVGDGKRVLEYYSKTNFVEVVPFHFALQMKTLTSQDPYKDKLADGLKMLDEQTYLVALNDCFYRYLGQYRYVLVIDWDEVVIPTNPHELIAEMADRAVAGLPDAVALMLSTAWHFDKFSEDENNESVDKSKNSSRKAVTDESKPPSYLHMQNHLTRTPVMKASQPKPVIMPYYALSINWHSVTRVPTLGDGIIRSNIPVSWQRYGFVHHFRKECKHEPVECGLLMTMGQTDEIVPRYRNVLQPRVEQVVRQLKLAV